MWLSCKGLGFTGVGFRVRSRVLHGLLPEAPVAGGRTKSGRGLLSRLERASAITSTVIKFSQPQNTPQYGIAFDLIGSSEDWRAVYFEGQYLSPPSRQYDSPPTAHVFALERSSSSKMFKDQYV